MINIFHNSHFHVINALTGKRNKLTFWCRWQLLPGKKDGSIQQGSKGRATVRIPAKLTTQGSIWEASMKTSPSSAHPPTDGEAKTESITASVIGALRRAVGSARLRQRAGAAEPAENIYTWGS